MRVSRMIRWTQSVLFLCSACEALPRLSELTEGIWRVFGAGEFARAISSKFAETAIAISRTTRQAYAKAKIQNKTCMITLSSSSIQSKNCLTLSMEKSILVVFFGCISWGFSDLWRNEIKGKKLRQGNKNQPIQTMTRRLISVSKRVIENIPPLW